MPVKKGNFIIANVVNSITFITNRKKNETLRSIHASTKIQMKTRTQKKRDHKQNYNMNKRNRKHNHHERSQGLLGEVEARAKDGRGGSHCCMQVHMGYIYILFLFFL